jgi:hypothetical protein
MLKLPSYPKVFPGAAWLGAGVLLAIGTPRPAAAQVQVTVNQTPIVFEGQPPVERGGRVLVPLRGVLERLGAFVRYDDLTKTVTALRGGTNITLPVGSRRALIGDRAVTLEVPATIVGGSVLVPLRFVAESLGARVTYDVGTQSVAIALPQNGAPGGVGGGGVVRAAPGGESPVPEVGVMTEGVVTAVYPDLSPKRIVVRMMSRSNGPDEVTIPLRPDVRVAVRRPNTLLAITLDRVRVGDTVSVQQTREGVATFVEVTARANASTAVGETDETPRRPAGVRGANVPGSSSEETTTAANVLSGEFLESSKIKNNAYVLKMTDGRLIEVPGSVLVLYGGDRIGVNDLRSGDRVTIAVDPKTKRGTRVRVAVEQ